MITRIATASEYETSEAARHVAELQNVLLQMPPAQQAMGFAILSLVQETAATSTATVENADEIWRAARLFRQFLKLSKAGKAIVEVAIAFVDIHHLGWMSPQIERLRKRLRYSLPRQTRLAFDCNPLSCRD